MEALSVPTLIVFGDRDQLAGPSDARHYAATPRLDKATIAGAGHSAEVERPAETADLIRRFVPRN